MIDALIHSLNGNTSEDASTFRLKLLLGVGEGMEEVWVKVYISGVRLLDGQGFNCQFWGSLPSDLMADHPELADLRFFRGTYNNFPTSRPPRGQLVQDRSR
ncbi:hypothetical protein HY857_01685 [Candidatus Saccharibacteria bacterium]|nr:hypothetical protein [Candidatus Saccharibacteria bacterium]